MLSRHDVLIAINALMQTAPFDVLRECDEPSQVRLSDVRLFPQARTVRDEAPFADSLSSNANAQSMHHKFCGTSFKMNMEIVPGVELHADRNLLRHYL